MSPVVLDQGVKLEFLGRGIQVWCHGVRDIVNIYVGEMIVGVPAVGKCVVIKLGMQFVVCIVAPSMEHLVLLPLSGISFWDSSKSRIEGLSLWRGRRS